MASRARCDSVAAAARLPGLVDALVDRVDRAGPAFEQRREDHHLEQQVEGRDAHLLQQEIGRQGGALELRDRKRPSG